MLPANNHNSFTVSSENGLNKLPITSGSVGAVALPKRGSKKPGIISCIFLQDPLGHWLDSLLNLRVLALSFIELKV